MPSKMRSMASINLMRLFQKIADQLRPIGTKVSQRDTETLLQFKRSGEILSRQLSGLLLY